MGQGVDYIVIFYYYLCNLLLNGISRRVNGKQKSIIYFSRDHSIFRGNKIIEDRKVSPAGNPGKRQGDKDIYAKVRKHK
jgi:hypothetical protein